MNKKFKKGIDYIGVTCIFFCHDGNGKILMHKRSKNCRDEVGNWDIGGGSLEFGEEFEEGVTREIQEEYCVTPTNVTFIKASNVIRQAGGIKTHWIGLLFTAEVNPKKVKIGEPKAMDELGWFSIDNLPDPLHSQFPKTLEILKKAGKI